MARSREEYLCAKREGMARLRARDPEAHRKKQRDWHSKNRTRQIAKMRAYYGKRFFWGRAMKLRGEERADTKALANLWKTQKGLCALTGRKMDRTAQLDHILPKARGGKDNIENLRWVCEEVNIAKRHMTDEEFINLCNSVIKWIGERIQQVASKIS
mgnify:CR=1 FL=1